ncbi:MAG: cysteine--tRNA ligase [Deltaproteobacteria bacterium]|nr:cysteine--tRNA ligase [Deltaproteobacteria bacterium]
MPLRLFNTLSGKKEEFIPLNPKEVRMYVCGVTVYDMCHIGHARAYVAFDVIVRYLREKGYNVTYVRNFTDVDDKIIRRASELGIATEDVTEKYIKEFYTDMEMLNVGKADIEPRVTDHISEIIALIQRIIDNGYAYVVGGDVYFSVESFPSYGRLSGRKLDDMKAGARVELNEQKRHPMDFALWKESKPGEPFWDSPWGKGRPGWHIECSAMSTKYLGATFDIHGGGKDLIFPHHENEIAQSEAAYKVPFVRYWLHNGFVNINEEKMSKSLGNFFTIREVTSQYFPEALRYFMLGTHYRSPISYSIDAISESEGRVEYYYSTLRDVNNIVGNFDGTLRDIVLKDEVDKNMAEFYEAMDDDFNTARAIANLSNLLRIANDMILKRGQYKKDVLKPALYYVREKILTIGRILGIMEKDPQVALNTITSMKAKRMGIDVGEVERLIAERSHARKMKDFVRSDEIRDRLLGMGITIMDTPDGTFWRIEK